MGGRHSRTKGRAWEQKVARLLRAATPGAEKEIRRLPQYQRGDVDPDVTHPVLWVECKCWKAGSIRTALRQAEEHVPAGKMAVAICKWDREEPEVLIKLSDFLEIYEQSWRWAIQ